MVSWRDLESGGAWAFVSMAFMRIHIKKNRKTDVLGCLSRHRQH